MTSNNIKIVYWRNDRAISLLYSMKDEENKNCF